MSDKNRDEQLDDHNNDGVDRRGFLKCMAWAGTGAFFVMQGGILKSYSLSTLLKAAAAPAWASTAARMAATAVSTRKRSPVRQ